VVAVSFRGDTLGKFYWNSLLERDLGLAFMWSSLVCRVLESKESNSDWDSEELGRGWGLEGVITLWEMFWFAIRPPLGIEVRGLGWE
jgi:hypothetical protein